MQYRLLSLAAAAGLVPSALASNYLLVDNYQGSNFFNMMDFYTGGDPTHGYVQYVDQGTANANGLIGLSGNTVYMGVDHTNVASGSGRQSVRVVSQRAYTHMLVTIDLAHMPTSTCGVWPAFWSLGSNWPNNGEIDIIEGVNSQNVNYMTLHTSANCAITGRSNGLLNPYSENCDAYVNGNAGCSFHETNTLSYGTDMDNNGGAQYAMEWTSEGISIWWWNQRNPPPGDMFSGNPNPSNWGPPSANWAGGGCDWDSHFSQHQLVFDTTFCGDWAGAVFGNDPQCSNKGSCNSWVQNNPGAFSDTYWSIRDLKVYQNNGNNNDRRDTDNATAAFEAEAHAAAEMLRMPAPVADEKKRSVDKVDSANAAQAHEATEMERHAKRSSENVDAANAAQAHEAAEMERHAKRAAASQIAPSSVEPASRTVNPTSATAAAHSGAIKRDAPVPPSKEKRAAASQIAPSSVEPASRTVNPASATAAANQPPTKAKRDPMYESRRRRYLQQ